MTIEKVTESEQELTLRLRSERDQPPEYLVVFVRAVMHLMDQLGKEAITIPLDGVFKDQGRELDMDITPDGIRLAVSAK